MTKKKNRVAITVADNPEPDAALLVWCGNIVSASSYVMPVNAVLSKLYKNLLHILRRE